MDIKADVVVVGCGIAGLSAAVSAQQAGAKVALLERAPKDQRGGNTRYTESFWRMKSENEVSEDLFPILLRIPLLPRSEITKDAVRDFRIGHPSSRPSISQTQTSSRVSLMPRGRLWVVENVWCHVRFSAELFHFGIHHTNCADRRRPRTLGSTRGICGVSSGCHLHPLSNDR